MSSDPLKDLDPLDDALRDALRDAMHERWDRYTPPAELDARVRSRFQRAAARRQTFNLVGALAGVAGVVGLALAFGAMLDRQAIIQLQPVVTEVEVTRLQPTPVREVITVTVEAPRVPFTEPHPILGDARVRQAMAYCTDRAALVQSVYPWVSDPSLLEMDAVVPPGHWAYPAEGAGRFTYPFDPAQGQALLETAGWKLKAGADFRTNAAGDELALKLTTTDASLRLTWTKVWSDEMAACGLRIVPLYTPSSWFFGESTGLRRRDFEVGAFAWVNQSEPLLQTLYGCDQVPLPSNQWTGQNYSGWCNGTADAALQAGAQALDRETRRAAFRTVQAALAREVPILPLFQRPMVMAANPALENFTPDTGEPVYTWNAAQWRLAGRDRLVLGQVSEPATLAPWSTDYVTRLLRGLIAGVDYTTLGFDYQPVTLKRLPTLESGAAQRQVVSVSAGQPVVDVEGNAVDLKPGVRVRTADGALVTYAGGAVSMAQLVVNYEFVDALTWSDGVPVSKADYALGYRVMCDLALSAPLKLDLSPACDQIAAVDFTSDSAYTVTWKPGYSDPLYFLPPIGRQPAHQVLSDGRQLGEVPPADWAGLTEVNDAPLGVGPYRLVSWEPGNSLVLQANPYYFAGPPVIASIEVRFLPLSQAIPALLSGAVDVLDAEALTADDGQALMAAQAAGRLHVSVLPSGAWEHLEFALFQR